MTWNENTRIAAVASAVLVLDQLTKLVVTQNLPYGEERVVIEGFFRFVHWGNTGAAWSMFRDNNHILSVVAVGALFVLFLMRRHFGAETRLGQIALGLMFGGIIGNIIDRFRIQHVVDFLYFYVHRRGGGEIGFPAFNVADSAICIGVGLLFILSWQMDGSGNVGTTEIQPAENRNAIAADANSKPDDEVNDTTP